MPAAPAATTPMPSATDPARALSQHPIHFLDGLGVELELAVVRHQSIDLLLHISDLCVADAREGEFGNGGVNAAQPLQRAVGGLLDARVSPGLIRYFMSGRNVCNPAEFGKIERRTIVGVAREHGRPRHSW